MKILSLLSLFISTSLRAQPEPIIVMYYERPPLYFPAEDGTPSGQMVDQLNAKLQPPKYKIKYQLIPPKRQFLNMEAYKEPICCL